MRRGDGEGLADLAQLVRDDRHDARARAQDVEEILDPGREGLELVGDLLDAELGEPLEAQVEDGAGLDLGQVVGAVLVERVGRVVDQPDEGRDLGRGPAPLHQRRAGLGGVGRAADGGHHLVHVRHRHREAAQDVGALTSPSQLEGGAARDDLLAEGHEGGEELAQRERARAPAVERQHVAAEGDLHRREAEELVEDHVGGGVALEVDDDAHAGAVGLVLDVTDALDALVARGLGNALDHDGLVHLVGDLVHNDGLTVAARVLDMGARANDHGAAPLGVGAPRARAAEDQPAGGKVRGGHVLHQVLGREVRVLDQRERGVDHLAQIVGRDVGRHAHRDAARAVDKHVGKARGQDGGLEVLAVVVRLEVDRVLLDVGQQRARRPVHADLGVAHGRGVVAVHRAEVALPVEQRQRHREALRHAHQRVVDRRIAVGVELAHDVAHGAGGLAVGLVVRVGGLVHGVKDAPMHGLEPVAQVRDRAGDDHAHGIIEERGRHLVRDGNGRAVVWHHGRRAAPFDVLGGVVFGAVRHRGGPLDFSMAC